MNIFEKISYKNIPSLHIGISIGAGVALSILFIGMLFKVLSWPGGSYLFLLGSIFCLGIIIITLWQLKYKAFLKTKIFLRMSIAIVLGMLIWFTEKEIPIATDITPFENNYSTFDFEE